MARGKGHKNPDLARADAIAAATESKNGSVAAGTITLSTGVVLRGVAFSPTVLVDARNAAVKRAGGWPKVPTVFIEGKGREEEVPDNPEYLARREQVEAEASLAMNDAAIMRGTELVKVPKGFPGPEDADWLESLAVLLQDEAPRYSSARYLYWIKHKAAPTLKDLGLIWRAIAPYAGVPEEDVADLVSRFPADAQWDSDSGGPSQP